ncbi:YqeB family protein [Cytobacillus horneckiae]|uniref:YqeB family protein n=1 Tax=Cytobacillus horneckiae TaxID=549687 RepID=UPI003D9A8B82
MNHHVTKLGLTVFERALILVIPTAIGGIVGWFLPVIVSGLKRIPILSSNDLIMLIDSFHSFSVSVIAMIIGIIAGFILSIIIFIESLNIFIDDTKIKLVIKEEETIISKNMVSAIFIEEKQLKLLDNDGKEIFSREIDIQTEKVKDAFLSHFYPWKNEDPYKSCFQLWRLNEEMVLGETIQSILYSRRLSLREKDEKKANQLKTDLNELGVIVKDRGEEQLIRRITRG